MLEKNASTLLPAAVYQNVRNGRVSKVGFHAEICQTGPEVHVFRGIFRPHKPPFKPLQLSSRR